MGNAILIHHVQADAPLAQTLARQLRRAGHRPRTVADDERLPADAARQLLLTLWTARSIDSSTLRSAALAQPHGNRLGVRVGQVRVPDEPFIDLPDEIGFDVQELLDAVQATRGAPADPFAAFESPRTAIRPPAPAAVGGGFSVLLGRNVGLAPAVGEPAVPPVQPVLLAASAPRHCAAGSGFTACLVAYIEATRESALRRLEQFGEAGDRVVSDLAPDGDARWLVGAPVTVRAAGPHLSVTPAERRFAWNGRENAAAFAVSIDAAAPAGSVELCFAVDVAGVTMAFIPMNIKVGIAIGGAAAAGETALPPIEVKAPRSLFASYSSKDAPAVTGRLSTLLRWSPGIDIFQDCLDLVPNETFKPQLAAQIKSRDAFVLFWSRHAAASPWVRWEYETARDGKGLANILPMPLEDPAIAPPPAEFADAHWRDRFMLAGYALQKIGDLRHIGDEAAGP